VGDKTYIDDKGYLRFRGSNKLVHRWVAHKYIYFGNIAKYPRPFSYYQVHHKDGNKLNNSVYNLQIVTEEQHAEIHNVPYDGTFGRKRQYNRTPDGCFIATASYGTPFAQEINILRNWRDKFLIKHTIGRNFIKWYYINSPPIAEFISKKNALKFIVRLLLKPIILLLSINKKYHQKRIKFK